jgi:phage gpG-like protein
MANKSIRKVIKNLEQLQREMKRLERKEKFKIPSPAPDIKGIGLNKVLNEFRDLVKTIEGMEEIFEECVDQAAEEIIPLLSEALDEAMESSIWPWDGSTRDIVDTGALRDSKDVSWNSGKKSIVIQYNEPYADLVQYGGYIKSGYNPKVSIYIPPRPWIDAVIYGGHGIQQFPFYELVQRRAMELLNKKIEL